MLYAKINNEYKDSEENAKKIVFSRTLKWVNRLYPAENKEVSIKPGKISSQLQYGYDTLFQGFRNAIEAVLTADYNDQITYEKSNEIIKKYNNLSSYLKNIINLNQMSSEDQERITKDFNSLRAKLEQLKRIAIDNNFTDQHDIVQMVDKINDTSTVNKAQYDKISAESPEMIKAIVSKEQAKQILNDASSLGALLDKNIGLVRTHPAGATAEQLIKFFLNYDITTLTPSEYDTIKQNYNELIKFNLKLTVQVEKTTTALASKAQQYMSFVDKIYTKVDLIKYATDKILNGVDPMIIAAKQADIEKIVDDYLLPTNENERKQAYADTDQVIKAISKTDYNVLMAGGNLETYRRILVDSIDKLGLTFQTLISALSGKVIAPKVPKAVEVHTGNVAKTTYTQNDFQKKIKSMVNDNIQSKKDGTKYKYKFTGLDRNTINHWNKYIKLSNQDKLDYFDLAP